MSTYIGIATAFLIVFLFALVYMLLFRTRLFDKYFQIHFEESYNMDDLFPIKIKGKIIPKVDYLEIPYQSLNIEIHTKTICGTIDNNAISLELIKLSDRKKSLQLIKQHYIKSVKSNIAECMKNKKEYIELINISNRQKQHMKKIACETCKHKMQCQIAFNNCHYEKETRDTILIKCVNSNANYELNM